ncbi:diguanylate cyclase domain-containing protein [Roseateles sp. MS654]|uniref:diguanylate cyclase domain-containing protein n=1 Tax=Roseateles sp. MS654 TaxID=3412685 RepID=UPI003C2B1EC4
MCSVRRELALLLVDLDHFKPVNETFGHPAGDAVLRLFGQRLLQVVRPADAVARVGGDEFAIALAGVRERAHAESVAAARTPFRVDQRDLHIGASVGISFQADPGDGWQALAQHADGMLYCVKAAGRGTYA